MSVAYGEQINESEMSVVLRDEWRERINCSSVQSSVEFEHAGAFPGWGSFHFTPFLGGGCLPIALEVIQHREARYFLLGL